MSNKLIVPSHIKAITVNLDRGKLKACQICKKQFSFSVSEHQCKRCQRAICEKCGPHKAIVQKLDKASKKPHRQCVLCKEELDQMNQFLEKYRIKYNFDSYSIQWLAVYDMDVNTAKQRYEQARAQIKAKSQNGYDLFKAKFDQVYQEMEMLFNYSMKDFIRQATGNMDSMKSALDRVIQTFLIMYPEVGYSADLVVITHFMLCFSSEASAYNLLTILYAYIVPSYLYQSQMALDKYDFENEIAMVLGAAKELQINQIDCSFVETFLQSRINRYILSLGINFYQFEPSFFILNQLFSSKRNYHDLLKCIASVVTLNSHEIKFNSINFDESEMHLMRNQKLNSLILSFNSIQRLDLEKFALPHRRSFSNAIEVGILKEHNEFIEQFEFVHLLEETKQLKVIISQKDQLIENLKEQNKAQDIGKLQRAISSQNLELDEVMKDNFNLKDQIILLRTENEKFADENISLKEQLALLQVNLAKTKSSSMQSELLESSDIRDEYQIKYNELLKQIQDHERTISEQQMLLLDLQKTAESEQNEKKFSFQEFNYEAELQKLQSEISAHLQMIESQNKDLETYQKTIQNLKQQLLDRDIHIELQNAQLNQQMSTVSQQVCSDLINQSIQEILNNESAKQIKKLQQQIDEQSLKLKNLQKQSDYDNSSQVSQNLYKDLISKSIQEVLKNEQVVQIESLQNQLLEQQKLIVCPQNKSGVDLDLQIKFKNLQVEYLNLKEQNENQLLEIDVQSRQVKQLSQAIREQQFLSNMQEQYSQFNVEQLESQLFIKECQSIYVNILDKSTQIVLQNEGQDLFQKQNKQTIMLQELFRNLQYEFKLLKQDYDNKNLQIEKAKQQTNSPMIETIKILERKVFDQTNRIVQLEDEIEIEKLKGQEQQEIYQFQIKGLTSAINEADELESQLLSSKIENENLQAKIEDMTYFCEVFEKQIKLLQNKIQELTFQIKLQTIFESQQDKEIQVDQIITGVNNEQLEKEIELLKDELKLHSIRQEEITALNACLDDSLSMQQTLSSKVESLTQQLQQSAKQIEQLEEANQELQFRFQDDRSPGDFTRSSDSEATKSDLILQQLRNIEIPAIEVLLFKDSNKPLTKLRHDHDHEDAKNIIASRDTQIQLLKTLIIDKQTKLLLALSVIQEFKQVLFNA